jgi:hypothetical protein
MTLCPIIFRRKSKAPPTRFSESTELDPGEVARSAADRSFENREYQKRENHAPSASEPFAAAPRHVLCIFQGRMHIGAGRQWEGRK